MATYTATTFANWQPKDNSFGVTGVRGTFAFPVAASIGDVVLLAKIPHAALPIELIEDHTSGSTALGVSFGLASGGPAGSATFSCYISAGAQATKNRLSVLGLPAAVSCSDTDPNRYGILACKVESGTGTTSVFVNFAFTYLTDETP